MTAADDAAILTLALHAVYARTEKAIDQINAGDTRRAIVTLRSVLPHGYRNAFEKRVIPTKIP